MPSNFTLEILFQLRIKKKKDEQKRSFSGKYTNDYNLIIQTNDIYIKNQNLSQRVKTQKFSGTFCFKQIFLFRLYLIIIIKKYPPHTLNYIYAYQVIDFAVATDYRIIIILSCQQHGYP